MAGNLTREKNNFHFPKNIPKNIFFALFFLLLSFLLLKEENIRTEKRVLGLQTQVKMNQKEAFAWEQILAERPDYRDGWIQLAAIYHKLGNKIKSLEAIYRAKNLDPNNETILSFEEVIKN